MKKLLISRQMPKSVADRARAHFDVTQRNSDIPMNAGEVIEALETQDAVLATLGDDFRAETFADANPLRCEIVANFGVGYNHIDADAARAAGVIVSNTPGAVTDATADIGVMLILMAARRASEGEALVRSGAWRGWGPTQLLGMHIGGKTLGIVGMGRIGRAVARRCQHGFGMKVIFYNRSPVDVAALQARQIDSLEELARAADVVVVALPGGAPTRHIIGEQFLSAMQPHAILVNIARGDIVDEEALIAALVQERIGGAGLDVYEHEPQVPEALRSLKNVTLLPHLGTNALEVRESMGMMALDNLLAWEAGREVPNLV